MCRVGAGVDTGSNGRQIDKSELAKFRELEPPQGIIFLVMGVGRIKRHVL